MKSPFGRRWIARVRGEEAIDLKLNACIEGYNNLIGTFGLPQTQQRYMSENIPKRKAAKNFSITDDWVSIANGLLKKGREMEAAGLKELDKGAVSLITSLDALVVQLNEPNVYYYSKAYEGDNFVKREAADAGLHAAFERSTIDMA